MCFSKKKYRDTTKGQSSARAHCEMFLDAVIQSKSTKTAGIVDDLVIGMEASVKIGTHTKTKINQNEAFIGIGDIVKRGRTIL